MAIKCKNETCNAWATDDGLCFSHSPILADKRALARSNGGKIGKSPTDRLWAELEPIKLDSLDDVKLLLGETINLVRTGGIDIRVANCIGNLSHYLRKTIEVSEIEKRVERLEIEISKNNGDY
jgi:hypothetical protein